MMVSNQYRLHFGRLVAIAGPDAQQRCCSLARGLKSVAPGPLDLSAFALEGGRSAFALAARSDNALTKPRSLRPQKIQKTKSGLRNEGYYVGFYVQGKSVQAYK